MKGHRYEYHGPADLLVDVSAWVSPEYGSRRAPSYWMFSVKARKGESPVQLIERVLRSKVKKVPVQERELEP
jgi:hypothetical protein